MGRNLHCEPHSRAVTSEQTNSQAQNVAESSSFDVDDTSADNSKDINLKNLIWSIGEQETNHEEAPTMP